jgi:hypothetical protein
MDRFFNKVKVNTVNDCWEWQAAKNTKGYGVFSFKGKDVKAHRWSYEYHNNISLNPKECVCHRCDNPVCVNPDHLWIGTQQDNIQDMIAKGRHNFPKPHKSKKYAHLLDQIESEYNSANKKHGMIKQLSIKFNVPKKTIAKIIKDSLRSL